MDATEPNLQPGEQTLSPGALTLLKFAHESDTHDLLARNAALRLTLELLKKLVKACQMQNPALFAQLTGTTELPEDFLSFTAALANTIDVKLHVRVPGREYGSDVAWASTTDFDHCVYIAMAQTLADAAWPESRSRNLLGPSIDESIQRIAQCSLEDLVVALLQNYIGNILQDYFDRARVRIHVRGLAPDTESQLRLRDARLIAHLAYRRARELGGERDSLDADSILTGLASAIAETLESGAKQ